MATQDKSLYTLISLDEFKAVLGVDDREDKLARFCIVTATLTIEQYCKRKLLRKKYFEKIDFNGDLFVPLREYPVSEVLAFFVENPHPCGFSTRSFCGAKTPAKAIETAASMPPKAIGNGEMLEPEFYSVVPDCGTDYDLPFSLSLSPAFKRYPSVSAVKVVYWAGYAHNKVPSDLSAACLELASWNMSRYRGRRVGMTGNIRGAGKEGEHFEMSMLENVKLLLEPYKRKTI